MNDTYKHLLIPAFGVVILLVLAMPKVVGLKFDYRKGAAWNHEDLIARIDFPIIKTEEQLKSDRQKSAGIVIPYYQYSESIASSNIEKVNLLQVSDQMKLEVSNSLKSIYGRGVAASVPEVDVVYIQKGKRASKFPADELLSVDAACKSLLSEVSEAEPEVNVDSIFRKAGVYDLVAPNIIFDKETSELVASDASNDVSPTLGYVTSGQVIVSEGEIVTPEIAQMLDSYRKEYNRMLGKGKTGIFSWLGCLAVSFILVSILLMMIRFCLPDILGGWRRFNYILTIFTLASLVAIIVTRVGERMVLMVPFTLSALYLQAFFKDREIVPIYALSLVPLLLFAQNGPALFVMFLAAGYVSIALFQHFSTGWKQFIMAGITFSVLALSYLGFYFADIISGNPWYSLLFLLIGSLATVAGYPLVYLFEKTFNLVSMSRLLELCDTSNPVIQDLQRKAPGTFQHSLQVMNMCDVVARSIGANVPLVRVGALYHDIGKTSNPLCFVENETTLTGSNDRFHAQLSPLESAKSIISHVSDGDALARKNHLPVIVSQFILTHHGTTSTAFFLDKFLKDGGDPALAGEFQYPGPKPSSKEQIILMLCDSVEAGSRSLKEYTPEAFDAFVEKIVAGKLAAGQFENSDISIQELGTVKDTIKSYLAQMYHGRVAYPDDKKTNKIRLWKQNQRKSTI